jgi:hypothetical protein
MLRTRWFSSWRPVLAASMMLLFAASRVTGGGPPASDATGAAAPAPPAKAHRRAPLPAEPLPLPANLKIPRYRPGAPPFHDGETLIYDASWIGIPAAEARVAVGYNKAHPEMWTGQMWINSSQAVDILYRMRDYFQEDFQRESYQPDNIYILQHEKQRRDEWHVAFDHDADVVTSVRRNAHGRTWVRRFSGGAPWGPFSGAMMALSQPLKVGENYTYDVFSGGNRYVFEFKVIDRERITTDLGTFDTLRIEPSVLWLSEGSFRSQARETTIWVTDDARHLPVRISCAVFIGDVTADLVKVTKESAKPDNRQGQAAATAATPTADP